VLRHRDLSTNQLRERLTSRGFSPSECDDALATLERTGVLDDRRFAENRARMLAGRGAGDTLIRYELDRAGVVEELIDCALDLLPPEERRAQAIVERRGSSPKTGRFLAAKGFSEESVAHAVATASADALG
jgi:SOS response regulatory protein OraA/RecX